MLQTEIINSKTNHSKCSASLAKNFAKFVLKGISSTSTVINAIYLASILISRLLTQQQKQKLASYQSRLKFLLNLTQSILRKLQTTLFKIPTKI